MKDAELNALLSRLREVKPTEIQQHKWKRAIRNELKVKTSTNRFAPLIAASVAGFTVGALLFGWTGLFHRASPELEFAENNSDNATIEYVLTKSN